MTYTPKTEDQLAEEALLADGVYDFEIVHTDDRPSKKGNDMFSFKLFVWGEDGNPRHVYDYLAMGNSFGERKLRHASVACGLLDIYNSGALKADDFLNKTGKLMLKQQKATDGFPPKNVVADYLPPEEGATTRAPRPTREIIDDEIPF